MSCIHVLGNHIKDNTSYFPYVVKKRIMANQYELRVTLRHYENKNKSKHVIADSELFPSVSYGFIPVS